MNVDVRVRGADSKLYPARAATEAERDRIVAWTHWFRCEERLSIREVARKLEEHGIRRSVGAIVRDLKLYRCDRCNGRPA